MAADPYRVVLRASLTLTLLAGIVGMVGGAVSYGGFGWTSLSGFVVFLFAPAWLLVSSLRSYRALTRVSGVLGDSDAGLHWDRAAMADAVALSPWGCACIVDTATSSHGNYSARLLYSLGIGLCTVVHVVLLPGAINLVRLLRRTHSDPPASVSSDPIRSSLKTLAKIRLAILGIGAFTWLVPWMSSAKARVLVWFTTTSELGSPAPGFELLLSTVDPRKRVGAWMCAAAMIVLACLALREIVRLRWPAAPRSTHTQVFAAWAMGIVTAGMPMFLWGDGWTFLNRYDRLLMGAWANLLVLATLALVLLAVMPLLLTRALRRRAEADRQAHLGERDLATEP